MEEKRKRGRPKKEGSVRCKDIHVRVTEAELASFEELCELTGETRVEALMEAVRIRLNCERYKL